MRKGFTLLEMLIVVAIVTVLASITIPKFGRMIRAANEAATRGKLGSIRRALSIYYADMEGVYPADLTPLMVPGSHYLTQVVPLYTAAHGNFSGIDYVPAKDPTVDTGAWGYITSGPEMGTVWVECTHTDVKGNQWNQY